MDLNDCYEQFQMESQILNSNTCIFRTGKQTGSIANMAKTPKIPVFSKNVNGPKMSLNNIFFTYSLHSKANIISIETQIGVQYSPWSKIIIIII